MLCVKHYELFYCIKKFFLKEKPGNSQTEVNSDNLQNLMKLHPFFSKEDCMSALNICKGDFSAALVYLDNSGREIFSKEFQLSKATIREMYTAHAGDIVSARKHFKIWEKEDKVQAKKKENWLKQPAKEKAKKIIKPAKIKSIYDLVDLGLLDESGSVWNIDPERWNSLGEFDKKMEWLYTAILLVDTDHAENFWDLSPEMKQEAIAVMRSEGFASVASIITNFLDAMSKSYEVETHQPFSEINSHNLTQHLAKWIIDHADKLHFFTVWED
jgi:hypothetical protein